jgi:hypothetical protein
MRGYKTWKCLIQHTGMHGVDNRHVVVDVLLGSRIGSNWEMMKCMHGNGMEWGSTFIGSEFMVIPVMYKIRRTLIYQHKSRDSDGVRTWVGVLRVPISIPLRNLPSNIRGWLWLVTVVEFVSAANVQWFMSFLLGDYMCISSICIQKNKRKKCSKQLTKNPFKQLDLTEGDNTKI